MMRRHIILALLLIIAFFLTCQGAKGVDGNLSVWLMLHVREYGSDMPISNITVSITMSTVLGTVEKTLTTNETGKVSIYLGESTKPGTSASPRLTRLSLSDNYTLIRVNNIFLEDVTFTARYIKGKTEYMNMQINVDQKISDNKILIDVKCWVLKGRVIAISSSDPVTGEASVISVKPAARVTFEENILKERYERYYFVPQGYEIIISFTPTIGSRYQYSPLRIFVDNNTSFINWMYYAAESYGNGEIKSIGEEIEWLSFMGLSLSRETAEYGALKNLLERSLSLYREKEYDAALNGMNMFAARANDLRGWLSNIKSIAIISAACLSLFVYGMSSLLSSFIFDEVEKSKARLATKILLFSLLMILFSLTNPSSKIAHTMIIEYAINTAVRANDFSAILTGTFVIGSLTYSFMTLISIRRISMVDLALQMGIRGLKRRPFRTILTLATIAIIVSSSILFINISIERETRVKGSWPGTETSGIIVESSSKYELSTYDLKWLHKNEWCMNISYMESVRQQEYIEGSGGIFRVGYIQIGSSAPSTANILCVNPTFMERHYNFSKYVIGFWNYFSEGEKVALLPKNYEVAIDDYIILGVSEGLITLAGEVQDLGFRSLGLFRVIGKFDPLQLLNLKRIDNRTLFEDVANIILLPIGAINDTAVGISEITVITAPGFDPVNVAKEVAYSLGLPVIANRDGLALLIVWSLEISAASFIPFIVPLLVAGLMIYVTMASVYEEKKRELFTLATLGLDPRNTFFTFIIETLLYGFFGTFIGFLGSYLLTLITPSPMPVIGVSLKTSSMGLSIFTIFVALFTGVVMVFLGGYIPSVRAQGLSLMGRAKTRDLTGELISEENNMLFILPVREIVQNSELLYTYIKEILNEMSSSIIDHHSIKSEIRGDGSFNLSFIVFSSGQRVSMPCEIRGERDRDIIVLSIVFPKMYRDYEGIRRILRDLEAKIIGFPTWRDMQLKMKIVREAPKKQKTIDETIDEIRSVIEQIKDSIKKIRILDAQKGKLSEEIYNEFRQKYSSIIDEKFKILRSMTIGLEQYSSQIQDEIKKTNLEIERITIAYNLGEISEEEFIKTCSPLQNKIAVLRNKLKEIEEIFEFLKKPMGII